MATQGASTFFSGFDMALLLGVLASILASNSRCFLVGFRKLNPCLAAFLSLLRLLHDELVVTYAWLILNRP